ncbi:hypothetical protein SF23_02215 [Streptomyces sp. MBRL 10]|nr:hypothetical protein SF23_02215 [Streptomyces sp. MBRL 10]
MAVMIGQLFGGIRTRSQAGRHRASSPVTPTMEQEIADSLHIIVLIGTDVPSPHAGESGS